MFSAAYSRTSASCPFSWMIASRASSFSNGVDAGGGAGDLDLGDFTRLVPLLIGSTISLFAPRTLALRGAGTNTRSVREGISRKNQHAFTGAGTHHQCSSPLPLRYWPRRTVVAFPSDHLRQQACSPCASALSQRARILTPTGALR